MHSVQECKVMFLCAKYANRQQRFIRFIPVYQVRMKNDHCTDSCIAPGIAHLALLEFYFRLMEAMGGGVDHDLIENPRRHGSMCLLNIGFGYVSLS